MTCYFDIETVPCYQSWEEVPDKLKQLFLKKHKQQINNSDNLDELEQHWQSKAALSALYKGERKTH